MSNLPGNLDNQQLSVATSRAQDAIVATFRGEVSVEDPAAQLRPFLADLDAAAKDAKAVVLDFTELNFMNSSGIKQFVGFLLLGVGRPADQRYKVRIRYKEAVTWQVTSLPVLGKLAPDVVELEAV